MMNDYISRQAAIRALINAITPKIDGNTVTVNIMSEQMITTTINSLPSADVPDTNVGDMISRQVALNALSAHKKVLQYIMDKCGVTEEVNKTLEIICNVPSADVVEVVRCKDCKLSKPFTMFGRDGLMCERRKFAERFVVENDDYCSYGERK